MDHIFKSSNDQPKRDAEWRKRLEGLVPEQVETKHVLVVGCGSVGSFMASELIRSGVRRITLVDPDIVEWANLTRTVYTHADLGRLKVEALRDHILSIFPDINVRCFPKSIQEEGQFAWRLSDDFLSILKDADLVISAVDLPKATGLINRYGYALDKPVVFVALYKGAKGGEVIVTIPEVTPCFHCSTGGVRKVAEDAGLEAVAQKNRDYGTNRLIAEVALGSDIHFVCSAAIKIVLSLLARGNTSGSLGDFMGKQLDGGCNFLMLGMEPDYFLFPSTHAAAVGQYAFQSIWAKTSTNPDCDVCGLPENRENTA